MVFGWVCLAWSVAGVAAKMSAEPRKGWAGNYTIQMTADDRGNISAQGHGNLSIQEVLLGVEVFKAALLKGATLSGRATVPGLDPKRF